MPIKYVTGDATEPQGDGKKLIVHCCNDVGAWGAGFVVPLGIKYPASKKRFLALQPIQRQLGYVQFVKCGDQITVANLIGQHGVGFGPDGAPPIRYWAINQGLVRIADFCRKANYTVHAPRFGSGLAGGDWGIIAVFILWRLPDIDVTIYDLEKR